jgi:hypothetical protein
VGKGLPGFGIKRAPSREGVGALDNQATPAHRLPIGLAVYLNAFDFITLLSLAIILPLWTRQL